MMQTETVFLIFVQRDYWLAKEAIRRKLSGVALKDESSVQEIAVTDQLKKLLKPK